jgi:hypothetical protein
MNKTIELNELLQKAKEIRHNLTGEIIQSDREGRHVDPVLVGELIGIFDRLVETVAAVAARRVELGELEVKLTASGISVRCCAANKRDAAAKLLQVSETLKDEAGKMLEQVKRERMESERAASEQVKSEGFGASVIMSGSIEDMLIRSLKEMLIEFKEAGING